MAARVDRKLWTNAGELSHAAGFGLRFRILRRSGGFSLLVILCLTLGIGATTSVTSWIEGILLRPFPMVATENRMVAMAGIDRDGTRTDISWPDLQDLQRNCRLVDAIIAEHIGGATLNIGYRADRCLRQRGLFELFRRAGCTADAGAHLRARRRYRAKRTSGGGDQLPGMERTAIIATHGLSAARSD